MRVVVTGAAGFVGSHVSERLLAAGHEVVGLDAFTGFYPPQLKEANLARVRLASGFRLQEQNLLSAGLEEAFRGAQAVCHLAGRPGARGACASVFEASNVRTTEGVMRAAAAAGIGRVVLASTSSVYGSAVSPVKEDDPPRPVSAYGRSKLRAELLAARLADTFGLELVILRYFTVYGPRQRPDMAFARYVHSALAGSPMPLFGDGRQVRHFTYVGDAAEATVLALEHGQAGGVYNVAGPRPAQLSEAFALLAAALGRQARLVPASAGAPESRQTDADLSRTHRELGYGPRVELADGLASQVAVSLGSSSVPSVPASRQA